MLDEMTHFFEIYINMTNKSMFEFPNKIFPFLLLKKILTQTMHEMTLLPSGCVNDTLQSPHLEVCTNEKIKIKIKIAKEVKL